jgi:hypothetical protein
MAIRMEKLHEGSHQKRVFFSSTRQASIKNKHKTSFWSNGVRTREKKAYLHRFKLMEHAIRVCNKGDQTIDHLINQSTLL